MGPLTGAGRKNRAGGWAFPLKAGRGFTLIELMLVITIIGILATIALPMYQSSVTKAREAALQENLFQMRTAIDKFYADQGEYPPSLTGLVEKKYIRAVPVDPFTGSMDTWAEVPPEEGTGVFDIRSGSDLVGRNGVPYSEW